MSVQILIGDCRKRLAGIADNSVHLCVSSPPYFGLRDYGTAAWAGGDPDCDHLPPDDGGVTDKQTMGRRSHPGRFAGADCWKCSARRIDRQMGLEQPPAQYVAGMVELFREVRRVLRPDGVLFLNLGDSYAGMGGQTPQTGELMKGRARQRQNITRSARIRAEGLKNKDLIGIPWRVAFGLQADGWWLRQDIIWAKPNPMPESVTDRCTKAHEYLFLLTKQETYFWDKDAIAEPAIYAPGCGWDEEAKGTRGGRRQRAQATKLDPEQSFRAIRPTRNKRSVWEVATQGFAGEFCTACKTLFEGDALAALRIQEIPAGDQVRKRRWCSCGQHDAWLSHFATFPPDLIEPCVLAGSPRFACIDCGAPFIRQYEKKLVPTAKAPQRHLQNDRDADPNDQGSNRQREGHKKGFAHERTPGDYLPGCKCQAPARPGTVLDPFGGAGTTGLVADRAGRDAILCELNPDFAEMARQRIAGDAGMFCRVQVSAEVAE